MGKMFERAAESITLDNLQAGVTGLLDRVWHCGVNTGPLDGQDWSPPVELKDEPTRYVLTAEMPGVDVATMDVSVQGESLIISGEKRQAPAPASPEEEPPAVRVLQAERRYGCFRRTVRLPGPVETEAVCAALTDGVLTVIAPKAAGAAPVSVRISVQAAGTTE